jgi:hypothetical protein
LDKKIYLLILILFSFFILLGCTLKENSKESIVKKSNTNDSNIDSIDSNNVIIDQNIAVEDSLVCVPKYYSKYFSYESKVEYPFELPSGEYVVTIKSWSKVDENKLFAYAEDIFNTGKIDRFWTYINYLTGEKIEYSKITGLNNGQCTFRKTTAAIEEMSREKIYKKDYLKLEKINGYDAYKLKQSKTGTYEGEVYLYADYVSVDYCVYMQQRYPQLEGDNFPESIDTMTKMSVDEFDGNILIPPTNCVEESDDEYLGDNDNYEYVNESDGGYDSSDYDSSDPCIQKCQEMREICQASGQEVNSTGTGCTCTDGTCPYERSCEYTCWSV